MNLSFSFILAFFCIVGALIAFSLPIFKFLDNDIQPNRANRLDGMRFYLASFVIFHHMDCAYSYFTTGQWAPISQWLLIMGKNGVALFFMTTAYLFWGKIRDKDNIDWIDLYKKRLLRIVPLTFFCSFLAISLLFIFTEKIPFTATTISNLLTWFDGGLWDNKLPVTAFHTPFIVLAGVTWTLKWEWMFYFSLPLLFILNKRSMELSIVLFAFSFYFLPSFTNTAYLWSYFFAGMLCKELKERVILSKTTANCILLSTILLAYLSAPTLYSPPETAFLAIIFFCIISGAELFGALTTRAAKRLGAISYSLYLTQGLVLFPVYNYLASAKMIAIGPLLLSILIIAFFAICLLSTFTYHFIELPFIKKIKTNSPSSLHEI